MGEHAANGGYEDEDWERVKAWDWRDARAMLAFVRERWQYADNGFWHEEESKDEHFPGRRYSISTAGWSDNEEMMRAMSENQMFWALFWERSERGGHYSFLVPEWSD